MIIVARKSFWVDLYTVGPIPVAAQDSWRKTRRVLRYFAVFFALDVRVLRHNVTQNQALGINKHCAKAAAFREPAYQS